MLISWVSKYDGRGTAAARKDFAKLGKTAISAKVSVAALTYAFGQLAKASVKAAMAEQQSLTQLNRTLENAGFGAATEQVNDYIIALQNASGVVKKELRPAFIQLFNSTGDVGASQEALKKAMDIAAGTGKDLSTTVQALSRAFSGNRESLNELNTGLDKTFLKTASLSEIMAELDRKFRGQAAAAAATLTGQFLQLQIAIDTVTESFGKGFIKELNLGTVDMSKFANGVNMIGRAFGFVANMAVNATSALGGLKSWFVDFARNTLGWHNWLRTEVVDPIGTLHDSITSLPVAGSAGGTSALEKYLKKVQRMQEAAAAKAAAEARKSEAQKRRQALMDKREAETAMKYDTERASLMKALAEADSEQTKKRLTDLLALNTATYAQALGLTTTEQILELINAQMDKWFGKQKSLTAATEETTNAYAKMLSTMNQQAAAAGAGRDFYYSASGTTAEALANISNAQAADILTNYFPELDRGAANPGAYGGTNVTVNVSGSLLAQQDLEAAIAGAVNSAARAGVSYSQIFSRL